MAIPSNSPDTVLETYVREHVDEDPKAVLEIALAETERLKLMAKAKAEVRINEDGKFEVGSLEGLQRLARMYASSESVPDQFRGDEHIADCAIAINLALRWGWDPLMVLQKCYVVHGRPGLESQLIIARANTSDVFQGRIMYELSGEGDQRQCTASALLAAKYTRDPASATVTQTINIALVKRMGWWDKKGSLWPKMPDLMLQYRSAAWLVRTVAPEVLMGVYMIDELQEMADDPAAATTTKPSLESMLGSADTADAQDAAVKATQFELPQATKDGISRGLKEGDALAAQLQAKAAKTRSPAAPPSTTAANPGSEYRVGIDPAVPGNDISVEVPHRPEPQRPADTPAQPAEAPADTGHDSQDEAMVCQEYREMIEQAESVEQVERCRRRAEEGRQNNEIKAETLQDVMHRCAKRIKELDKWEKAKATRTGK